MPLINPLRSMEKIRRTQAIRLNAFDSVSGPLRPIKNDLHRLIISPAFLLLIALTMGCQFSTQKTFSILPTLYELSINED